MHKLSSLKMFSNIVKKDGAGNIFIELTIPTYIQVFPSLISLITFTLFLYLCGLSPFLFLRPLLSQHSINTSKHLPRGNVLNLTQPRE